MKIDVYDALVRQSLISRRGLLKGATALAGAATLCGSQFGAGSASAQENVRAQILKIPGIGKGTPTEADHIKVGELCLGPTKATVKQGEFAGVELTFMGAITSGVHNMLFRPFLKSWEEYTGAKIIWIDLVQTDYNPRLMQSIASGTMDWDLMEMGALLEGDVMSKGLLDEMPEWVAKLIDIDDYVDFLKAPVGTWNGKTYRVSGDGDVLSMNYRKDYFSNPDIVAATGMKDVPKTWQEWANFSKKVNGLKDPLTGNAAYGYLDSYNPWGG